MKRAILGGAPSNVICYHGSEDSINELDFSRNLEELGFHCGTYEQADSFNRPHMYKLELDASIKRCPKVLDQDDWASTGTIKALDGIKHINYLQAVQEMRRFFGSASPTKQESGEWIREYLIAHNIHALRYLNDSEGVEYDMNGRARQFMSYLLLDDTYIVNLTECD